jgi:hypothetical protein
VIRILKKTLLILLLGWLPLQASALPVLALLCEQDPSEMHGGAVHGHHAHHGEQSEHDHEGGDDGSSTPSGSCCHNLSSAALLASSVKPDVPPAGAEPTPLFHPSSFLPDQPLQPPLAA